MKKLISILLILAMLLCFSSCGGNNNNPSGPNDNPQQEDPQNPSDPGNNPSDEPVIFDKSEAIKPDSKYKKTFKITDFMAGVVTLEHINTEQHPDVAQLYLDLAYECLKENSIEANVEGIYYTSLGLASLNLSYDPILIDTDSESIDANPLFMVVVSDYKDNILVGSFREADVTNNAYATMADAVYQHANESNTKKFFPNATDITAAFKAYKLKGVEPEELSDQFNDLYESCMTLYYKVTLNDWYDYLDDSDTIEIDYNIYENISNSGICSLKDLKNILMQNFSEKVADDILSLCSDGYIERDGKLYATMFGIGGPYGREYGPVCMAKIDDNKTAVFVECSQILNYDIIFEEDSQETPEVTYYGYMFIFDKDNNGHWKCSDFTDVKFSRYTSATF